MAQLRDVGPVRTGAPVGWSRYMKSWEHSKCSKRVEDSGGSRVRSSKQSIASQFQALILASQRPSLFYLQPSLRELQRISAFSCERAALGLVMLNVQRTCSSRRLWFYFLWGRLGWAGMCILMWEEACVRRIACLFPPRASNGKLRLALG